VSAARRIIFLAKSFLQSVQERVVVYDGAMGTNIQFRNPSVDDFWGKEGCNELLVLSRPDIISDIHAAFYKVGCDVVETNTFGSTRIVLAEYQLEDKVAELNIVAAQLAKKVAADFSTPDRPRYVADPSDLQRSCPRSDTSGLMRCLRPTSSKCSR
jgi:5-methyltetrahydrofolate--homocysteine methyltransferase